MSPGDRSPRPHRPVPYADLTGFIDAAGGVTPSSRAEVAAATAAVLVRAGRGAGTSETANRGGVGGGAGDRAGDGGGDRLGDGVGDDDPGTDFVDLADRVGLETLAALWQGSDPVSLPGSLWALYLLRQWFRSNGEQVRRLWRAGVVLAPADAVVAGVADPAEADDLARAADAILAGVYRGDLDVALERAAAVFRVIAAGRRDLAGAGVTRTADAVEHADATELVALAERNERTADDLAAAAQKWRAGTLG